MNGCIEWHASGPYDFAWQAHRECAASTGWTWSNGGCARLGPGGFCDIPYTGGSSVCAMTEWDYFYAGEIGADEVQAQSESCFQYGGSWTEF
jgi:hypothetical protein